MIKPRRISSILRDRKRQEEDPILSENLRLTSFEYPIPTEFLTPIDDKIFRYLKKNVGNCVIYYASPQNDTLKHGYYEVVGVNPFTIMTSKYGEYVVDINNCYFTQELVYAYSRGLKLIYESTSLEDSSTVIKELQTERWEEMAINSYELE